MAQVPITIMVEEKQLWALEYEAKQKGVDIPQKLQEQFEKMHERVSDKTKAMIDFVDSKGVFSDRPQQTQGRSGKGCPPSAKEIVDGKGQMEFDR